MTRYEAAINQSSHDILRAILNSSSELIAALDHDFRYLAFNQAYQREFRSIFGRIIETGMTLHEALAHLPQEQENAISIWGRALRGEEFTETWAFGDVKRQRKVYQLTMNALRDAQGTSIGAVAVFRDVTAQRQAEEEAHRLQENLERRVAQRTWELADKEQQLGMAMQAAKAGAWQLDLANGKWSASPEALRLFGLSPDTSVDYMMVVQRVVPEDRERFVAAIQQATEFHKPFHVEYQAIHEDGSVRWIASYARIQPGPHGLRLIGLAIDVTEQKQIEQALRESNERYRLVNDATNDAIWDWDLITDELDWNEAVHSMFGFTHEMMGNSIEGWYERIHPEDRKRVVDGIHAAIDGGGYHWSDEYRFRCVNGSYRTIFDRGLIARDEGGRAYRMIGSMLDLTERKEAEQAIKESEDRFREAFTHAPIGMTITTPEGRFLHVNPMYCQITGYSEEELLKGNFDFQQLTHPEDVENNVKELNRLVAGEIPAFFVEKRYIRKDGSIVWVRASVTVRRTPQGQPMQVVGLIEDITARKQAEAELLKLAAVVENSNEFIGMATPDMKAFLVNEAGLRMVGLDSLEDAQGLNVLDFFWPEDRPWIESEAVPALLRDGYWSGEVRFRHFKTGKPVHTMWSPVAIRDDSGRVIAFATVSPDLGPMKQAEAELRESEERFRTMADNISQFAWMADPEGWIFWYNRRWYEYTGTSLEEMEGWGWQKVHHPDHVQRVVEKISDCFEKGILWEDTFPLRSKSGQYRWFLSRAVPIRDAQGKVVRWFGTNTDVTEQKLAESELRQSEERFREVLEKSLDAVYRRDLRTDTYDYISPVIQDLMGLTLETMRQLPVDELIDRVHPEDRNHVARAIEDGTASGFGRVQYRFRGSDERYRWLEDQFTVTHDKKGQPRYRGGVVRDVTERKRVEEALQQAHLELEQRVQERTTELQQRTDQLVHLASELTEAEQRERKRMAQVLHDHLQQMLVAAKLRVSLARTGNGEEYTSSLHEVEEILGEAINTTRSLSAELHPAVLHEHGLVAGLEWLAKRMEDQYELEVTVEAEHDLTMEDDRLRVLFFDAVRELLFNVVKYAQTDQAVVALRRLDAQTVQLCVEDQGQGFDVTSLEGADGATRGLGLFSIRERLAIFGGHFSISSRPAGGTRVVLNAPSVSTVTTTEEQVTEATEATADRKIIGNDVIRVLIVDDHPVVRQGVAMVLQHDEKLEVVGEAGSAREALALLETIDPDVVLMDVSMPEIDGIEGTRRIKSLRPHIRVIGLSMNDDPATTEAMRRAGAERHLPKSGNPAALISTILGQDHHPPLSRI